jgi:hypothetical protein
VVIRIQTGEADNGKLRCGSPGVECGGSGGSLLMRHLVNRIRSRILLACASGARPLRRTGVPTGSESNQCPTVGQPGSPPLTTRLRLSRALGLQPANPNPAVSPPPGARRIRPRPATSRAHVLGRVRAESASGALFRLWWGRRYSGRRPPLGMEICVRCVFASAGTRVGCEVWLTGPVGVSAPRPRTAGLARPGTIGRHAHYGPRLGRRTDCRGYGTL